MPFFLLTADGHVIFREPECASEFAWFTEAHSVDQRWDTALRMAIGLSMTARNFRGSPEHRTDPGFGQPWPSQSWFDSASRGELIEALRCEGAREIAALYEEAASEKAHSHGDHLRMRARKLAVYESLFGYRSPNGTAYRGIFGRSAAPSDVRSMDLRPNVNAWWPNNKSGSFQDAIVFADIHT